MQKYLHFSDFFNKYLKNISYFTLKVSNDACIRLNLASLVAMIAPTITLPPLSCITILPFKVMPSSDIVKV